MNLIDFRKDVVCLTDIGLVRQANEDNYYATETPNGFLFVLCDGMGGHVGGDKASSIAVSSIVSFFVQKEYTIIQQALADALIVANKQILIAAKENPDLTGMGTTACIILIQEDKVWFAHVGDSRIYLYCNEQQRLHRLTKDHSVVQGLIDMGFISEEEAEHHSQKNQILKTLGVKDDLQPDICTMSVLPANDDIFLICSDGLTGMVADDILQHILTQNTPLSEKAQNMLTLAKQAGGTDNITLQLIKISNSPHRTSIFESKNSLRNNSFIDNKSRKKTKNIIKVIGITLVVAALISVIFLGNLFEGKKDKKREQITNTKPNTDENYTTWKDEVQKKGYKKILEEQGVSYYGKRFIDNKAFQGIKVERSGLYFVGEITFIRNKDQNSGSMLGPGTWYDEKGNEQQSK